MDRSTKEGFKKLRTLIHELLYDIHRIQRKCKELMGAADDLKAKVQEMQAEVDATQQRVADHEAALNQIISDLRAAASGDTVPVEDVNTAITAIQTAIDDLKTTDA